MGLTAPCPPAPPLGPLTHRLALLTRLGEDNHQMIRRLSQDLEQVTRRNDLFLERARTALDMVA